MKNIIPIFLFCMVGLTLYGQSEEPKSVPFIKTGYGYFNDQLMIDGNVLSSEVGLKMKNNYLFSLKINFADAVNDIAFYYYLPDYEWNFIYSYKWVTLNIGYEFMTKNRRHSFVPMMGPYFYHNLITYPMETDDGGLSLKKNVNLDIGIELSLQYLYNFKNGISLGLNTSGCLGFINGPSHLSVMPVVGIKLK